VTLTREQPAATANFDLTGFVLVSEDSVVKGIVRGGAGQTVRLSGRPMRGRKSRPCPDDSYRFAKLPAVPTR